MPIYAYSLWQSPNNTDYLIFSACLRNTNVTNRFLTFRSNHSTSVYILPEYYSIQVSENISSKTRVVAKIDFKYATCQKRENLPKERKLAKRDKILCSFYYQSNDSTQRLEMPQNCDKPVSSTHFATHLHIIFAARW